MTLRRSTRNRIKKFTFEDIDPLSRKIRQLEKSIYEDYESFINQRNNAWNDVVSRLNEHQRAGASTNSHQTNKTDKGSWFKSKLLGNDRDKNQLDAMDDIAKLKEQAEQFCASKRTDAANRREIIRDIIADIYDSIKRIKYANSVEAREKLLCLLTLRTYGGGHNAFEKSRFYSAIYQSVLTIEELNTHIFEYKNVKLIKYFERLGIDLDEETIENQNSSKLEYFEKAIISATVLYNIALTYVTTTSMEEEESDQTQAIDYAINSLDFFAAIELNDDNAIAELKFNHEDNPYRAFETEILKNFMNTKHVIGGLTQLSFEYAAYIFPTDRKSDFTSIIQIFKDENLGGKYKTNSINRVYTEYFSKKVGTFPLGTGIYFVSDSGDKVDKGVVIKFKRHNNGIVVSQVTKNQKSTWNNERKIIAPSRNFFFHKVQEKLNINKLHIEKLYHDELTDFLIWNPGAFFNSNKALIDVDKLYQNQKDLR